MSMSLDKRSTASLPGDVEQSDRRHGQAIYGSSFPNAKGTADQVSLRYLTPEGSELPAGSVLRGNHPLRGAQVNKVRRSPERATLDLAENDVNYCGVGSPCLQIVLDCSSIDSPPGEFVNLLK
jgi:hypothetical protein